MRSQRLMREELSLAELLAALSLATDVGVGRPIEKALRTWLIALRLKYVSGSGSAL